MAPLGQPNPPRTMEYHCRIAIAQSQSGPVRHTAIFIYTHGIATPIGNSFYDPVTQLLVACRASTVVIVAIGHYMGF
jgi:hypothetical protein